MDIVYKNTFTMTLERYLYFCDNPVGAEAKVRNLKILSLTGYLRTGLLVDIKNKNNILHRGLLI